MAHKHGYTPASTKSLYSIKKAAPEDGLAPVYKAGPVEIPNLGFLPGLSCMLGGSLLARDWMYGYGGHFLVLPQNYLFTNRYLVASPHLWNSCRIR